MINFRFHIASLIAVFLALAVGILVGSTVIDQAIVENLDHQIDRVELKADERKAENDRLKSDLDRLEAYIEGSAPFTVGARLDAVPVAVVAERGVGGAVASTVTLLAEAGAAAPVIFWLEPAWRLDEADDVERLAGVLGDTDTSDPVELRDRALAALAGRLAGSQGSGATAAEGRTRVSSTSSDTASTATTERPASTTTVPDGADVLETLVDAGFVSIEEVGGTGDDGGGDQGGTSGDKDTEDVRFLLVGGTESELFDTGVLVELARACLAEGSSTVAAEVYVESDEGPDRGAVVSPIVGDDVLDESVTTVDDLDLVEGRVSAVIGLEELADGTVGHYGYGSGASRSLPEWTGR